MDVTPLAGLAGLQALTFRHTEVEDIAPLTGLVNLTELDLFSTPVNDVTPLADLAALQRLDLSGAQVVDLIPLSVGLVPLPSAPRPFPHICQISTAWTCASRSRG